MKFTGFALSCTAYGNLEDIISQMCKDSGYINIDEVLPDCFKRPENTQELLSYLDLECRLMTDGSHLCSVSFLNKCLEIFVKRSEQEAVDCVKKGLRPDKLLNQQDQEDVEEA